MPKGFEIDKNDVWNENKNANVASSVQFRNEALEPQKRINYQSEFDRLHRAKRLTALHPT